MNITNARYILNVEDGTNDIIIATIDGVEMSVPIVEGNRHHDEIMSQVADGTLTIADAD